MKNIIRKIINRYLYILNSLRINIIRLRGAKIEEGVKLYGPIFLSDNPKNLKIKKNTVLNSFVTISCRDKISIGKNCHISSGVNIHTGYLNDDLSKHLSDPISIGDNCWLASNCTIAAGVTISSNVKIGANSFVNKDILSHGLYVGSPVRKID